MCPQTVPERATTVPVCLELSHPGNLPVLGKLGWSVTLNEDSKDPLAVSLQGPEADVLAAPLGRPGMEPAKHTRGSREAGAAANLRPNAMPITHLPVFQFSFPPVWWE